MYGSWGTIAVMGACCGTGVGICICAEGGTAEYTDWFPDGVGGGPPVTDAAEDGAAGGAAVGKGTATPLTPSKKAGRMLTPGGTPKFGPCPLTPF